MVFTEPNITELKNHLPLTPSIPADGPVTVYVQGYYKPGDGGGGIFIFDPLSNATENLGIIFKSNSTSKGRWVRQYYGHINVMYFGVTKYPDWQPTTGTVLNAARIQNAIDYAFSATNTNPPQPQYHEAPGDLTVYFPAGSYWIDSVITLKQQTHIKGDDATLLNMQMEPDAGLDQYMFKIEKGAIGRVCVENIMMDLGAERPNTEPLNVGGFLIEAEIADLQNPKDAGLWAGIFKDIKITNMLGHGIYLSGSDGVEHIGKRFNQYIYFDNLWIERKSAPWNCIKMTGAQLNLSFTNCQFSLPYQTGISNPDPGANISIRSNVASPQTDVNAQISFIGCAIGGSPGKSSYNAAELKNADSITFENCWFEDTEIAISLLGSTSINIQNSRFANASGQGRREGDCIRSENSRVNIENNYVMVSSVAQIHNNTYFIRGIGDKNVINSSNNSFTHVLLSQTFGITQYVKVAKIPTYYKNPVTPILVSGIETSENKLVLVRKNDDETKDYIYRINSSLSPCEMLYIRAEERALTIVAGHPTNETMGRNIYLSGLSEITLAHGQGATFIKIDGINNQEECSYQMISKF